MPNESEHEAAHPVTHARYGSMLFVGGWIACITILAGICGGLGWQFNLPQLRSVLPGLRIDAAVCFIPLMSVSTAVLFMVLTAGTFSRQQRHADELSRLHLIIDALPILISYINKDLRYEFVNRACENWFGVQAIDIIGKSMAEVLGDETLQTLRPHIDTVLSGQTVSFERLVPYRFGGERFVRALYIPHSDSNGAVSGFYIFVEDISERKQSEAALIESEKRARLFVENTPIPVAMFDREMRYLQANNAWIEEFGLVPGNFIGKTTYELFPDMPPHWKEVHRRCLAGATEKCEEETVTLSDRRAETLRWAVHPWYSDSREIGGIIIYTEVITSRKLAETALQKSLKELSDIKQAIDVSTIVAITDAQGVITYVNDAFCHISKFSREELLGKTHRVINSSYHSKKFFRDMWMTIGEGKVWKGAIRNKAKDGTFYWVDTTIYPFLDPLGKPFQYVAIRHDITRQKQAEEELLQSAHHLEQRVIERTAQLAEANLLLNQEVKVRSEAEAMALQAKQEAEEASRQKTRILSFVSHDFKNPLSSLSRFVDVLKKEQLGPLSSEQREIIDYIDEGVGILSSMVKNILDKARLEEGRVIPSLERIEPKTFIEQLKPMFDAMAAERNIEIHIDIAPDLLWMEADPTHLRQILINLLSNAIKYNHPEGAAFLKLYPAVNGHFTVIEVRDTGFGIPAEKIPLIFTEYYRTDLSQTESVEGTGLGLAFIKKLIDLHGGGITVDSEVGTGSTFKVSLPLTTDIKPSEAIAKMPGTSSSQKDSR